jgi:hypothetical protein
LQCCHRHSGGKPNPRYDDLTRFVEAKLGKPPHVLEPDKLKQFLDHNRQVGALRQLSPLVLLRLLAAFIAP